MAVRGRELVTLAILAVLLVPAAAVAEYRKLDGIVAVVDDDVVLASELMDRLDLVRRSSEENGQRLPPNDILVSQIMERLIIENLQRQEAERRGVTIDDETLSRAVGQFAQNNNMTFDEFRQALAADGNNFRQFREDIRAGDGREPASAGFGHAAYIHHRTRRSGSIELAVL